jgi:hypothetical protein
MPTAVTLARCSSYALPWPTPASSNSHVLKRVLLCVTTKLRPSTLSLGHQRLQALRAGTGKRRLHPRGVR